MIENTGMQNIVLTCAHVCQTSSDIDFLLEWFKIFEWILWSLGCHKFLQLSNIFLFSFHDMTLRLSIFKLILKIIIRKIVILLVQLVHPLVSLVLLLQELLLNLRHLCLEVVILLVADTSIILGA